jgi:hypothetical protein
LKRTRGRQESSFHPLLGLLGIARWDMIVMAKEYLFGEMMWKGKYFEMPYKHLEIPNGVGHL